MQFNSIKNSHIYVYHTFMFNLYYIYIICNPKRLKVGHIFRKTRKNLCNFSPRKVFSTLLALLVQNFLVRGVTFWQIKPHLENYF